MGWASLLTAAALNQVAQLALCALQGHVELSREETLEKLWPAITASGRLNQGGPAGQLPPLGVSPPRQLAASFCMQWLTPPAPVHPPAAESEESRRSLADDPLDAPLLVCMFRRFMERGLPEAAAAAAVVDGGSSGRSSCTAMAAEGAEA